MKGILIFLYAGAGATIGAVIEAVIYVLGISVEPFWIVPTLFAAVGGGVAAILAGVAER